MAKIICPNKQYTGVSASVAFANGVGQTNDPRLIEWFKSRGYAVEDAADIPLDEMSVEQLKAYAKDKGIDIGKTTSYNAILKRIKEAEKAEPNAEQSGEADDPPSSGEESEE